MGGFIVKTGFPVSEGIEFDEIIDVRSPAEYAEDHISGAVNLPVLSDSERKTIGTIYKQDSAFEARKLGAAMVSANIARHIESHLLDRGKDYRPLLYCWRGGQRSGSMAQVLNGIGWQVVLLDGGYRTYRRHVIREFDARVEKLNLIVLNGFTGAGKTLVLRELREQGEQILDLEDIARHKGSVFGGDPENPQPAQKRFESQLYDALVSFDPSRPVYIEAESAKIGNLNLPNPLWQKMKESPVIELKSPPECRAENLLKDYGEWLRDVERIETTIDRLQGFHANELLAQWKEMARSGEWSDLAVSLLEEHYDIRYQPSGQKKSRFQLPSLKLEITKHDKPHLAACAESIRSFRI